MLQLVPPLLLLPSNRAVVGHDGKVSMSLCVLTHELVVELVDLKHDTQALDVSVPLPL